MNDRHQPCSRADDRVDSGQVEGSILGDGQESQLGPPLPRHLLPGNEVAVMLHSRCHDLVAGLYVLHSPASGHEVQSLRSAPGPYDAVGGLGIDEARHLSPSLLHSVGRLHAQRVDAPVHVGVVPLVEVDETSDHRPRLLRGGRVVEIDQRHAVDPAGQYGEVLPDPCYVKHCCIRLSSSGLNLETGPTKGVRPPPRRRHPRPSP